MEYDTNYNKAVEDLNREFGDLFDVFHEEAKIGLIEQKRQLLDNKWREDNLKKAEERRKRSVAMAKEMLSRQNKERIGKEKGLPAYKRYKSVSVGFEESCEFKNIEANPIVTPGAKVYGFRKETVLGMKERIINLVNEAESYENVTKQSISYMYFKIFNNGKICSSTKSIYLDVDNFETCIHALYKEYDKVLDEINNKVYGYESMFDNTSHNYTSIRVTSLYFPKPRSVLQWGTKIPRFINCGIFDIFTANDPDIDCVIQCSNYIWPNSNFDTIEKISTKSNGNLCIVHPQLHINDVKQLKSYSDLRIHTNLPIKSLAVIDPAVIYLIQYKEHLGVLSNMRGGRRDVKKTTFKPLSKFSNDTKVTVCFDIESYFDPENEKDHTHIPYLCCASFIYDDVIGNIIEFEGRDCVAQMIEHIAEICFKLKNKNVELIAHNGGAYDFHYILSSMYDPSLIQNILIRNNNFISFTFKHEKINFSVKDSYSFLLCSLANAAKAFLDTKEVFGKTDFPHHEVRTAKDLETTYRKWISVDTEISTEVEKEKLLITSKEIITYGTNNESRKLIDWAKEYCCNDVLVLARVWLEFKKAVTEIFKAHVVDQTYTLAGLSFKLFEAHLDPGVNLHHPNREDYMNMRDSLIGGRCISMNGIYEDILCLDVKSLYPAAMSFYDQPYGDYRRVRNRPHGELGIYYVKVNPNVDVVKSNFFPIRFNNKITYNNYDKTEYNAWYTSVDIDIGISEGHEIDFIPFDEYGSVGYSWKLKGKIFQKYIENVLYTLKLQYEQENNKVKRQVIKIIMNSLWGKFAQKWIDTEYSIKLEADIDFIEEEAYKIWETDYMLVKSNNEPDFSSKPIQNGVFTLSWARHHMKLIWDSCASPNAEQLYSDTDSIFVRKNDFNLNGFFELNGKTVSVIGSEVGQLELECTFSRLLCAGKKQYMGFYKFIKNGEPSLKEKKRFKGVPAKYIQPDLYTHLLENPNNSARISFLKFKREWGSIKGYIEHKNVRAT